MRLDHLRVRHLKLLDLVASQGSLTAAAQTLGIGQPSATKLLQELERSMNCTLVDRSVRGGSITPAGARALERLRPAIQSLGALKDALDAPGLRPVVRLGLLPLAEISVLPALVRALEAEVEPAPVLRVQEGAVSMLIQALLAGELDALVGRLEAGEQPRAMEPLAVTPLFDNPYQVACAAQSPVSRRRRVALAELQRGRWVLPPRRTHTRQVFDQAFTAAGLVPPAPHIETPSFHASFAVIHENPAFLTVAPSSAVAYYAAMKRIANVRLERPFPEDRMVFLARTDMAAMPALARIRQCLVDLFQNPVPLQG